MRIMYTKQDGTLTIVSGAPKEHLENSRKTKISDKEYSEIIWGDVPKDAINPREVLDKDIPSTREFRNAWRDTSKKAVVDIDLEAAREIKIEKIRVQREKLFKKADIEFMAAIDSDDPNKLIASKEKRNRLRNLTEPLKKLKLTKLDQLKGVDIRTYVENYDEEIK